MRSPRLVMPAHRFFEPSLAFVDWLSNHARGARIIDCGAGMGHVELALRAAGHSNVLSLDLVERRGCVADVLVMDACRFPFEPTDVVMVCRPCHADWIGVVLEKAVACGAEFLYVGLPRNLEQDLGELVASARRPLVSAGEAGEVVLAFGDEPDLRANADRTVMVSLPFWSAPQPMRDGGDRWFNCDGGWFYKDSGETVHDFGDGDMDVDVDTDMVMEMSPAPGFR